MRPVVIAALIALLAILSLFGGYFVGRDAALRDNAADARQGADLQGF